MAGEPARTTLARLTLGALRAGHAWTAWTAVAICPDGRTSEHHADQHSEDRSRPAHSVASRRSELIHRHVATPEVQPATPRRADEEPCSRHGATLLARHDTQWSRAPRASRPRELAPPRQEVRRRVRLLVRGGLTVGRGSLSIGPRRPALRRLDEAPDVAVTWARQSPPRRAPRGHDDHDQHHDDGNDHSDCRRAHGGQRNGRASAPRTGWGCLRRRAAGLRAGRALRPDGRQAAQPRGGRRDLTATSTLALTVRCVGRGARAGRLGVGHAHYGTRGLADAWPDGPYSDGNRLRALELSTDPMSGSG